MGFESSAHVAVRENAGAAGSPISISCPRCGATNSLTTTRCRSCLTALPSKAAPTPAPRTLSPTVEPRRRDVGTVLGPLESLTREDTAPSPRFQCPECGRFVDEASTRCVCGVVFEEDEDLVEYACPICGSTVPVDADVCPCGARFSD